METQQTNSETSSDNNLNTNQQRISGIWESTMAFLHDLLDIRQDSDRDETIEAVRKDISFQGHNAWILIFSIFVASIGLNADSTAVVIGAMLISPLMGPIVGMGLGTAINDDTMMRRSWTNLLVMVGLSLLTASLYFLITPIKEITSELDARTFPTILDVLIAIFGGLALIVAKAKKGTISNAIAGVAIATALMPPLCTAGFGIATGSLKVFGGAMYLFCINAVFIALATFVVCKLLKFPMVKYANQAKRKRVSRWATAIGVFVLLPSVVLFYQLYSAQVKEIAVDEYFKNTIDYVGMRPTKEWNKETNKLDIVMLGEIVPQPTIEAWKNKFYTIEELEGSEIEFFQGSKILSNNNDDVELVQEELIGQMKQIQNKDVRIAALENELRRLSQQGKDFDIISKEVRFNYPEIASMSYAESVNKDFITQRTDTISVYNIVFNDTTLAVERRLDIKQRLANWLQYRLKSYNVKVNEIERSVTGTAHDSLQQIQSK
ncbi:hypothetical protein A9Q93_00940 [Nonlabens dokdonensis]|uniref:Uncharacterized protein n=1 Tax=Nonlabens dokdonensis TaxID=328515 RepID=A0A1Z8BFQ8_9FLAO|nr:DUF389 domain-containing protein [Nonlabens dokdonensis]OUS21399.1 hypothetical protein A9Q93_00940 [Nonlabens dokdonensis]